MRKYFGWFSEFLKGINFIEFAIIVVIVAIISSIAIPGLIKAREAESKTSAKWERKVSDDEWVNYHVYTKIYIDKKTEKRYLIVVYNNKSVAVTKLED